MTLTAVQLQDNAKRFGVTVGNAAGSATSALATLNVTERAWSVLDLPPSGGAGTQAASTMYSPAIAVDSHGHTHAVFNQQETNGSYAMWAAIKPAGAANFTSFTRLSPTPAPMAAPSFTFMPALAADGNGHVLAVWRNSRPDETSQVVAAVYVPLGNDGGAWGEAQNASDPALLDIHELAVAPAGNGAFEVVYLATLPEQVHRDVVARRASVAGAALAWSAEVVLDDNPENNLGIKAVGNQAGQVLVAWANGGAFTEARGVVRNGSAAWSAPFDIGGQANENLQPASLAIDSQGRGVVAMMGEQARVYVRGFDFGGAGFALTGVAQYVSNFTHYHVPPVAVAGAGGRFDVLSLHNLGRQISRVRFDGSSWGGLESAHIIDSTEGLDIVYGLAAGVDGADNLIVTWAQRTDPSSYPVQRARRYHAGLAQWRDMAEFFTTDRVVISQGSTALAVRADGSALALVVRGDGVVGQAVFK